ncbi:MAG: hypothetical protein NTX98_02410 [Candidatus Doudnabacteria bacterium]|nr:hypothetical protein [Candidatus Doudnabacteria bacterium]
MFLLGVLIIILSIIIFGGISAAKQKERSDMSLKKAYLYLVSVISLVIAVVGAIMLINLALKTWVFKKADMNYYSTPCVAQVPPDGKSTGCDLASLALQQKQADDNRTSQRQQQAAQAIAMIVIATPVWWGHWRLAKREA